VKTPGFTAQPPSMAADVTQIMIQHPLAKIRRKMKAGIPLWSTAVHMEYTCLFNRP